VTEVSVREPVSGSVRSGRWEILSITGARCSCPPEQANRVVHPASISTSCFIIPAQDGEPQSSTSVVPILWGGSRLAADTHRLRGTALATSIQPDDLTPFKLGISGESPGLIGLSIRGDRQKVPGFTRACSAVTTLVLLGDRCIALLRVPSFSLLWGRGQLGEPLYQVPYTHAGRWALLRELRDAIG
jgi:hypothetical protein